MNPLLVRISVFLGILAVIAITIIIVNKAPQPPHHSEKDPNPIGEDDQRKPCDSIGNPDYCRLYSDIYDLGDKPWDKYAYNRLKEDITTNGENGKLKAAQEDELGMLLDSKYMQVLGTAIKTYCRTTTAYNAGQQREFNEELNAIPISGSMQATKTSLTGLLSNFTAAVGLIGQVKNYVATQPYNESTLQQYTDRANGFKSMEVLSQNTWLQNENISPCFRYIADYKNMYTIVQSLLERAAKDSTFISKIPAGEIERSCTVDGIVNRYYNNALINSRSHE